MKASRSTRLVHRGAALLASISLALAHQALGQCNGYDVAIIPAPICPITGPSPMAGYGISDQGHVCGVRLNCDFDDRAFLWNGTAVITINTPSYAPRCRGLALNSAGTVVGWMRASLKRAFLFQSGAVVDLGLLPGG